MKLQILNIGRGIKVKVNNITVVDLIDKLTELTAVKGNRDFKSVLDTNQVNTIYDLIARLFHVERKDARILYDECRDTIIDMLKAINYVPLTPNNKNKSQGQRFIPTEIKCLLWYMAYRAFELYNKLDDKEKKEISKKSKPSNQAVLDLIKTDSKGNTGFSLSRKTFEYFAISPKKYYEMCNYEQIWLPTKYAGEKTGYLGYAVNYLAQSAGVYENFLDLFGGSGYASLAIDQDTHIDYHINEYNFFNINFYKVMADEKLFKQFMIVYQNIGKQITDSNYDVTEGTNLFNNYKSIEMNWSVKYDSKDYQKKSITGITWINGQKYQQEDDDSKVEAAFAFFYLNSFKSGGNQTASSGITSGKLEEFCNYPHENLKKAHCKFKNLKIHNSDAIYNDEFVIQDSYNRVSRMYKPVDQYIKILQAQQILPYDLSADELEDIEAMAGRLGYSKENNKLPRSYRTLIYSDSPYLETRGYGKKTKSKKTSADGNIDVAGMHTLIGRLLDFTSEGNKFIFSCRSTGSKQANSVIKIREIFGLTTLKNLERDEEGSLLIQTDIVYEAVQVRIDAFKEQLIIPKRPLEDFLNLLSANQSIYENLFLKFKNEVEIRNKKEETNKMQLYVLLCLDKKYKLDEDTTKEELVKTILDVSDTLEVFITNFDFVEPFDYDIMNKKEIETMLEDGLTQEEKEKRIKELQGNDIYDSSGKHTFYKLTLEAFCDILETSSLRSTEAHLYTVSTGEEDNGEEIIKTAWFRRKKRQQ